MGIPSHSNGTSLAIWDHTVLPDTRHKWTRPALTAVEAAEKRPLTLSYQTPWREKNRVTCQDAARSIAQLKRLLQLRFDFDSTRQSGHHHSIMKAWIHTRRHFTSEVCEKAIPTSTIEGCYPMLIRQRECHSYYRDIYHAFLLSTTPVDATKT